MAVIIVIDGCSKLIFMKLFIVHIPMCHVTLFHSLKYVSTFVGLAECEWI